MGTTSSAGLRKERKDRRNTAGKVVQESQTTLISNVMTELLVAGRCYKWVKYLLCKQRTLCSDPRDPQKQDIAAHVC